MRMYCKACGKKYYPSPNSYIGYPQSSGHWDAEENRYLNYDVPVHARVFHSRGCWEKWTALNINAYTLWLQGMGNDDNNNETIEERNNNYG